MVARKATAALFVVVLALSACDSRRGDAISAPDVKERQLMEAARSPGITIPAIDTAAPARTETATFALG